MSILAKLRVPMAVGYVTFRELVRDRILYNVLVVTGLLFGISLLASQLTFLRPERVILDFGVTAVAISCGMIAIFCGAMVLIREFERRTIAVALSRPITRTQFVTGKFLGLAGVLALNWLLASSALLILLWLQGESGLSSISITLIEALVLTFMQSLILAGISLFFSTFSTTSISAMITLGIYFVGTNVSAIRTLADKTEAPAMSAILKAVAVIFPDFESFSLGTQVTYGLPVEFGAVALALSYGITLIVLYLIAASLLVRTRET